MGVSFDTEKCLENKTSLFKEKLNKQEIKAIKIHSRGTQRVNSILNENMTIVRDMNIIIHGLKDHDDIDIDKKEVKNINREVHVNIHPITIHRQGNPHKEKQTTYGAFKIKKGKEGHREKSVVIEI